MTRAEKINVMASWIWDADCFWENGINYGGLKETDEVTYDEPIGNCDGSQWLRHTWACTPAMWADARKLAATF